MGKDVQEAHGLQRKGRTLSSASKFLGGSAGYHYSTANSANMILPLFPQTKTPSLGRWVSQQRSKYKARDLSGQVTIDWNEEHERRYLRLKQIGFCFFIVLGRGATNTKRAKTKAIEHSN